MSQLQTIGRIEAISILDLELFDLDVKIDTGAYSNSLHCDEITIENNFVSFRLLDKVHKAYHNKKIKMPLYKEKKVKSSNGTTEKRAFIQVKVRFFNKIYKTIVSLTNRKDMKYPMLIGRKFLQNRFLVDVSKKNLTKEKEEC
jgi:hypothetical protein